MNHGHHRILPQREEGGKACRELEVTALAISNRQEYDKNRSEFKRNKLMQLILCRGILFGIFFLKLFTLPDIVQLIWFNQAWQQI
jgi:hypothetical protein